MKRLLILPLMAIASGCAVLGESEFSCKGYPTGATCMSATQVYNETHDRDQLHDMGQGEHAHDMGHIQLASAAPTTAHIPGGIVPPPARPVPVRKDPVVMRIWMAPWINTDGDLDAGGYVFTEVQERTWNVGAVPSDQRTVLRSVQLEARTSEEGASISSGE